MSSLIVDVGGGPQDALDAAQPAIKRIRQGRDHRKQFEPTWHSNLAFAAGKHWLEWSRFQRALVMPAELRNKELYTADVIGEYRTTALGELGSDDDRPELLLRRDDRPSEEFQHQLNKAVSFGWESEWDGDAVLDEVDGLAVDIGTAAIRCRFEPDYGPVVQDNVPYTNGSPVLDTAEASALFEDGPNPDVTMQPIRQGKICWDVLSPFNLIVPPGVPRERDFPWECVVRPVLLSKVQAQYGAAAAELREDGDIGSVYGWTTETGPDSRTDPSAPGGGPRGRLRDHVWLFTYLERPTKNFPQGRTITLATNRMVPLKFENTLPVCGPDGTYRSGLEYFHWWRVTGRFWSRGLIEVMKDGQRQINKRRTQINEIIDRGMPFIIVEKDSNALTRRGTPVEFVEIDRGEVQPQPVSGVAPGPWMQGDVEALREDLEHATGIKAVRLGENPGNVNTYSQLALINENDQGKRQKIMQLRKRSIAALVEDSVHFMRTYWGPQRQIALAGDEDQVDAAVFDATQIPAFYIVRVAKGAARPRSQAAELQKIQDIWNAAVASAAVTTDPEGWIRWYKDSLEAGQALEIPETPADEQAEKAQLENHLMLQGQTVEVDYFDPPQTHIPIHRGAQIQARLAGEQPAYDAIEQHVQEHLAAAQQNAAQVAAIGAPAGAPPGGESGGPGSPPLQPQPPSP